MDEIINPFDSGGYTLATMTEAINSVDNRHSLLGDMGLFREEGVTQRTVVVESVDGVLSLLPSVPLGGPATVAGRDTAGLRSFVVPWIPHNTTILPGDLQGVRRFGSAGGVNPLAEFMARSLARMAYKHDQTHEYMRINALRGILKDGSGATLYNFFTEFGVTQQQVDFLFGTATTAIQAKVRQVLRMIETELKGEVMTGVLALVSPGFFDALTGHAVVADAYKHYATTGAQPLRDDTRQQFPFAGIMFREYNATVTLSTGATESLIPAGEGIAFPLGTRDTFVTHFAPANTIEAANTIGVPMYARQLMRRDGSGVDVMTESSPLPLNRRPRLAVRLFSSN